MFQEGADLQGEHHSYQNFSGKKERNERGN